VSRESLGLMESSRIKLPTKKNVTGKNPQRRKRRKNARIDAKEKTTTDRKRCRKIDGRFSLLNYGENIL